MLVILAEVIPTFDNRSKIQSHHAIYISHYEFIITISLTLSIHPQSRRI